MPSIHSLCLCNSGSCSYAVNYERAQTDIVVAAGLVITDFPRYFNEHKETSKLYGTQEACHILQYTIVFSSTYDLTEEIESSFILYSNRKKEFLDAMRKLQNQTSNSSIAYYTCEENVLNCF